MSEIDYIVLVNDKLKRPHINLPNEYNDPAVACNAGVQYTRYVKQLACLGTLRAVFAPTVTVPEDCEMVCKATVVQETKVSGDGALSDKLPLEDTSRIKPILNESEVFSDKSKVAWAEAYEITLTTMKPVKVKLYHVLLHLEKLLRKR